MELMLLIFAAMFRMSFTLFVPALGESISQRAGVYNVAAEGYMLFGALGAYLTTAFTHNAWIGVFAGILSGMFLSLVHAYFSINIKANQFVSGMALWLFSMGFTSYIFRTIKIPGVSINGFNPLNIPYLTNLPYIGKIIFNESGLFYIGLLLILIFYLLLYKTRLGLMIRSTGENPYAVDMAGYSVYRIRYTAVLICGAMSGLGGAYLPLVILHNFNENMTAGRGFIALCIVILGRWNPVGVFLGSILFAAVDALQMQMQVAGSRIPYPLLLMLPYVITIIVLVGFGPVMKKAAAPKKLAVPYEKGEE
ncbi:MAG: ABC transporter permease [Actinobacteria bacterium]|nr:ABC transporter permease [Actinomycetota bacterium]MCL5070782.1 ABC transporter permease [Actinomycetota bacterium]